VDVGLAADIGTLQRFPKITGNDSLAREFALTGRKFSAKEAREIGFVSEVVDGGRAEVLGESDYQKPGADGREGTWYGQVDCAEEPCCCCQY
jgi:enoyl-CoA hydratase/carnithine racemase